MRLSVLSLLLILAFSNCAIADPLGFVQFNHVGLGASGAYNFAAIRVEIGISPHGNHIWDMVTLFNIVFTPENTSTLVGTLHTLDSGPALDYLVSRLTDGDVSSAFNTVNSGIYSSGTELYNAGNGWGLMEGSALYNLTGNTGYDLKGIFAIDSVVLTINHAVVEYSSSTPSCFGVDVWTTLAFHGTQIGPLPPPQPSTVPEPSSLTLLGLGLVGLMVRLRSDARDLNCRWCSDCAYTKSMAI